MIYSTSSCWFALTWAVLSAVPELQQVRWALVAAAMVGLVAHTCYEPPRGKYLCTHLKQTYAPWA